MTFPIVITVNYLGDADGGPIMGAYVGSFLLAGSYLAITCLTSAMTRNQVISFIVSVVICLMLVLASFMPNWANNGLTQFIADFSVMTHIESFQLGLLDSRDILFFLTLIVFSLFTTAVVVKSSRG